MSSSCAECGSSSKVVDSRDHDDRVRRRRKCLQCGSTWHTIEIREEDQEAAVAALWALTGGRRTKIGAPGAPPADGSVHPLIDLVFREKESQKVSYDDLAASSQVSWKAIVKWRSERKTPRIDTLESVLGALGWELTARRKRTGERWGP